MPQSQKGQLVIASPACPAKATVDEGNNTDVLFSSAEKVAAALKLLVATAVEI